MKNTLTSEHQNFNETITWFWQEYSRKKHHVNRDGLCQCESEKLIKHSSNPDRMRAFLMISVFLDQFFYIRCNNYEHFRSKFKLPKLYSHPVYGHHPAEWFCYGIRGSEVSINWKDIEEIASIAINDIKRSETISKDFFIETRDALPEKIRMDFNSYGETTKCGEKIKTIMMKYW